jgi:hypothetical protein
MVVFVELFFFHFSSFGLGNKKAPAAGGRGFFEFELSRVGYGCGLPAMCWVHGWVVTVVVPIVTDAVWITLMKLMIAFGL